MNKLKTWLHCNFIYVLFCLSIIYTIFVIFNNITFSKYKGNEQFIVGKIEKIAIDGDFLNLTVKGQEKIVVYYTFKTIEEKNNFNITFQLGDYVKLEGTIEKPNKNRVFNLFNYQKYLYSKHIYWVFKSNKIIKIENNNEYLYLIKNKTIKRIENIEKSEDYVKNFVLADNAIDREINESYRLNGISHLLAISGGNVYLLASVLLFVFSKLNSNIKINYLFVNIILALVLFITNFPIPVTRAILFFNILSVKKVFDLKFENIKAFLLLLTIFLLYNPYHIFDLGFLFSFIISFFLIKFSDIFTNQKSYLINTFLISLVSFLASIPILINNFFEINFMSLLSNIFYVPYFSLIIFPLSLLTFIFPILDNLLFIFITISEKTSLFLSNIKIFTIIIPYNGIIGYIIYYIVIYIILVSFLNKKYYKFLYLILLIIINKNIFIFNKYPIITMIDVGQGDSILIELPHKSSTILIDTGGIVNYKKDWQLSNNSYSLAKSRIIPYLKSRGITKIDYLIFSHGDHDHIGEGVELLKNFKTKSVILNSGNLNNSEKEVIDLLKIKKINYFFFSKNILKIKNYSFYFLNQINNNNENEDSLIIYTNLNDKHILFTGDIGFQSEYHILQEYSLPKLDILKIAHHGSKYSTSEIFLEKLNPKLAIISAGVNNRFNHPSNEVLDLLKHHNINVYMTNVNGTIKLILKDKIMIKTCF